MATLIHQSARAVIVRCRCHREWSRYRNAGQWGRNVVQSVGPEALTSVVLVDGGWRCQCGTGLQLPEEVNTPTS